MKYAMRLVPMVALAATSVFAQTAQQPPSDAAAPPAEKAIDANADRMLRQMTDYLAGLKTFRVQSQSVDEVVTTTGRKIQVSADSIISVARPNKLRSDRIGAENGLEYWYDGKTMSLYCKANNTYSTVQAPATIDEAIDATRKTYKIDAPGADLLFSHPYDVLTEQVKTGTFIGRETVEGVAANHLAFEGDDVDWQIWIQEGTQPLPLRFVITTKTMNERPQFTVQLSHWEPDAKIADTTFQFTPPAGASSVASFPTDCRAQR
jgi:hypothetical protein